MASSRSRGRGNRGRGSGREGFEELKSPNDLIIMKTDEKLKHFFKCGLYGCSFTTHNKQEFSEHLKNKHDGKKIHCCYCLKKELNSDNMANHIVFKHHKRVYQCSKCFYRACSNNHLHIHIKNRHTQDPCTEILICNPVELPVAPDEEEGVYDHLNTILLYTCAIGDCNFKTLAPKEFEKHNETLHRTVTLLRCYYCKTGFLKFKSLMTHYRLHELNVFQCNYCIHGANTEEKMFLHICNAHPDEPLEAFKRASEEASSEIQQLNIGVREECSERIMSEIVSHQNLRSAENSSSVKEKMFTGCENELYHIIAKHIQHIQYILCFPRYLKNLMSDVICGIPFCNEKFLNIHDYINHLRNVHEALNFPCPNCPEMCDSWEEFKNHLLCHGSKLYACGSGDCKYYHWSKDKVKDHKKGHGDSDVISIGIREFTSSADENKLSSLSIDIELPDVKQSFTCIYCKYKCSDKRIMKMHLYKEIAYQRFDCSLCEKKCLSRQEIKDHFIKTHPNENIVCSANYNIEIETMVKLILTQQEKFADVKLRETCDMCCRKFKNPLLLQSHLYICLQKEYRPYECHHCNEGFVSLLALKYHTDEHHSPKAIDFSLVPNSAIEKDIEKNLSKVRVKQLKEVFVQNKIEVVNKSSSKSSKRSHESSSDDFPNKRIHFNTVYVSTHCGGGFTSVDAVTAHSKKAHSRSEVEYKKISNLGIGAESSDCKFYKCDFCKFTSEKYILEKHLATKHNMRVTCCHCNKRFEFASKLKEHHDATHKDLPLKYSRGIINLTTTFGDSSIENTKNEDKNKKALIPEKLSHYGKKPDPIDLYSLTINMKLNGGESADLPLVYVTERFNMFPKLILKDVMKTNLN